MVSQIILFLIGFFILIKGSKIVVGNALTLARRLNLSNWVVGILIVGIGTSIPEFSIGFLGNLFGENAISLGTIVGSNTFNILAILGLSALVYPLAIKRNIAVRDTLINILAVAISLLAINYSFFGNNGFHGIDRKEGLLLLGLFIIWFIYSIRQPNTDDIENGEEMATRIVALPITLGVLILGFMGVVLGANWVVAGAETLARSIGMSEAFIGLTIVGIGTSLPELSVSVTAAFKKQPGIAVGNIIGSNIFDFLMILGISSAVRPMRVPQIMDIDILITIGSLAALFFVIYFGKRDFITRKEGFFLITLYLLYFVFLIVRG